ncbi:hypothetical protein L596_003034 [Steinernema carpocapsae]|uniref:ZP domain-containing protein n=1 Tax=Steinernema carpocapsae TaxID=34508 RepID=A0A4U8USX2_STECR|nr:hypothetical protein L596_003034 [Steinernema carpocapsae]
MALFALWIFFSLALAAASKYPNEIIETPTVVCESDRIIIKVRTTSSNPSLIYAEEYHENPDCVVRHMNKIQIFHNNCGMSTEKMKNPSGTTYRICLAVQIHPLFVTEADRSYCAQCVYMDSNVVEDLQQTIAVSESAPNELDPQFDEFSTPRCSYSIRRGTVDGPPIHYATIGEKVFHVWQCENDHIGMLVQNCYVEDMQGNKILIVDQNGCGVDQYVLSTPQYSSDLKTAYQESHVFKFAEKTVTRFTCQLRLCMNHENGCDGISPPNCGTREDEDAAVHSKPIALQPPPSSSIHEDDDMLQYDRVDKKPPSISPTSFVHGVQNTFNKINRDRRQIILFGNGSQFATVRKEDQNLADELPELDVVGVLRVLDTPEDVEYFEERLRSNSGDQPEGNLSPVTCLPKGMYIALIVTVALLVVIQIVAFTLVFVNRTCLAKLKVKSLKQSC